MRELPAERPERRSIQGTIGSDRARIAPIWALSGPAVYSPDMTEYDRKQPKTAELVISAVFGHLTIQARVTHTF